MATGNFEKRATRGVPLIHLKNAWEECAFASQFSETYPNFLIFRTPRVPRRANYFETMMIFQANRRGGRHFFEEQDQECRQKFDDGGGGEELHYTRLE